MSLDEQRRAYVDTLAGVPAERRADAVWSHCASDAAVAGGQGLLVGVGLSLLLRRPYTRGLVGGVGAGAGLGWAGRKCTEKHAWLQATEPARQ
jgi:hypothetical protein